MTKASDNDFPSMLLTEQGSAPTTPAASHQRLYIDSSTHKLTRVNSSGTPTTIETTGGTSQVISFARASKTSGNTTLTSATEANVDTGTDLTLAAASGDIAEVWINALIGNTASIVNLDVATIVSASPVHYFGAGLASSAQGLLGWSVQQAAYQTITGTVHLVLASGDISGGNVLLRLRYKRSSVNNTLFSASDTPFYWGAKILRVG